MEQSVPKVTFVHPTATVYPNVTIGEGVYIGAYCIIGSAPEYPNRHPSEPHGGVIIGDGSILFGHNTVDAATEEGEFTIIGRDCTLMKSAHVGHNCLLHHNVTLSCGAKIGGYSHIGNHSTVGLNATVHQKSTIAEGTMIGANCFFKGNGKPFTIYVGVPHKPIGDNWRLQKKLGLI
jgi:UDP-N-acetylglucosamine acyltransferase